jgi:hypothetical protein
LTFLTLIRLGFGAPAAVIPDATNAFSVIGCVCFNRIQLVFLVRGFRCLTTLAPPTTLGSIPKSKELAASYPQNPLRVQDELLLLENPVVMVFQQYAGLFCYLL